MMDPDILVLGGTQTPYFRNSNFSAIYMDCEMMLLEAVNAPTGSVRRRMIWNSRANFGSEVIGSSGLSYAA